ncbi:MAG TPA: S9 family peptidase, partial [Blastocatellia bacterium]
MKRYYPLIAILLAALAVPAMAQKRAFTIEDLYKIRSVADLHVSPDGKSVVYVLVTSDLPRAKQSLHIWMMQTDGTGATQMTQGDKNESSPVFSPDGKWIAFVSDRDSSDNLYVMPVGGGEARKLTDISTGVSSPLWSPDGKSIAFSTDVYPECGADDACNKKITERWQDGPLKAHMADHLLYRHWTQWKDGTRSHIFLADVATGGVRDMTPGDFDSPTFELAAPLAYAFSPDGKELAYVSDHDKHPETSTNKDIWVVSTSAASKPESRDITASNPAYDGTPRYSP